MKLIYAFLVIGLLSGCSEQIDQPPKISSAHAKQPRAIAVQLRPLLTDELALPVEYREAAKKVAAVLISENENPANFRLTLFEASNGAGLQFNLQHISESEGHTVLGNPGGKGRVIEIDLKTGTVSKSMYWQ